MIILLTGPTGSGKTDTSWELFNHFDQLTFFDCDWFASTKPFSWDKTEDVEMVYQALSNMIEFHLNRSQYNFVITLTPQMALAYHRYCHHFTQHKLPIYLFRLSCKYDEVKRRILQRDRLETQKKQELSDTLVHHEDLHTAFSDEKLFKHINTTKLSEHDIASIIKKTIHN